MFLTIDNKDAVLRVTGLAAEEVVGRVGSRVGRLVGGRGIDGGVALGVGAEDGREGDVLRLKTDDTEDDTCPYMIPVDLPLRIAYEDEHVTVVDKPPMMPAHPSYQHRLDTVANALAFRYSDAPFVFRPVNRLDRDTSGLMLTARTRLAASRLYLSMVGGEIRKYYIALLEKEPPEPSGIIETYMKRVDDSIIMRRVCEKDEEKARLALTAYKVLYSGGGVCAVIASPVTGRTHQLRVHFSHVGCPLLGDTMYGGNTDKIDRHALHSAYLSFPHPEGGVREIVSTLPADMRAALGDAADAVDEAFKREIHGEIEELRKKCREIKEKK